MVNEDEQMAAEEEAVVDYETEVPVEDQSEQPNGEADMTDQPAVDDQHTNIEQDPTSHDPQPESNTEEQEAGDPGSSAQDPLKMPPHGTEVFFSRLPREATDDQLKEFCQQVGEVFSIRIPKDPGNPGQNKGYAFCVYKTKDSAASATVKLNQAELSDFPGKKVSVQVSLVKNRLYIGAIPRELTKEAFTQILNTDVKGVDNIELLMEKDSNLNRGFGFVEFYNHACAEAARKKLSRPDYRLQDRQINVTWAEPKRNEQQQEQVKAIYVGNLPETVTDSKIKDVFAAYGEVESVVIPRSKEDNSKPRDYCFVHYKERASALKAVESGETDKPELDGKLLTVAMAKPQTRETDSRQGMGYGYSGSYGYQQGGGRGGYGASGYRQGYGSGGRGAMQGTMRGGRGGGPGRAPGRGPSRYPPSDYGAYEAYDDYGDYGDDYGDDYGYGGGYGSYSGYAGGTGGMSMVPMMLPNGQVGYVLSGSSGAGSLRRGSSGGSYGGGMRQPAYGQSSYGGASGGRGAGRSYPPRGGGGGYSSGGSAGYSGGAGVRSGYGARGGSASGYSRSGPGQRYQPY